MSEVNIDERRRRRRDGARTVEEGGGKGSADAGRGAGEGVQEHAEAKPVLILDYPSVMAQLSPLHLRVLPKFFEVVLVGRTRELTQGELDMLGVNAVEFYYDYPDAEVRARYRAVIREIIKEFGSTRDYYFSSLHWWAMEEASKSPVTLIPPPAIRSIAIAIAKQNLDKIRDLLYRFSIKIVK